MKSSSDGIMWQFTGKAGECAVASQLYLKGVPVFFPMVDTGVDLMTQNGCRIQVKSAHMVATDKARKLHGDGCYIFSFNQSKVRAVGKDKTTRYAAKVPSSYCDVMAFWGIETSRFWIVPSYLCDDRYCVRLGIDPPGRYVGSERHLLEMKALGYSNTEIAGQYGISRSRVSVMLNHPETIAENPAFVTAVRACENAWENIIDFDPAMRGQKALQPEAAQEVI